MQFPELTTQGNVLVTTQILVSEYQHTPLQPAFAKRVKGIATHRLRQIDTGYFRTQMRCN